MIFRRKPKEHQGIEIKPKIPRKDRFIVLACWIGLTLGIRQVLFVTEPVRWLGTLGALFASVAIVTLLFRYYKPVQQYQTRFTAVIRSWYGKAFLFSGLGLMLVFGLTLVALEYGHSVYGQVARDFTATLNMNDPAYDQKLILEIDRIYQNDLDYLVLLITIMDVASHEQFRWLLWIMTSEQAEFVVLVTLVRKGLLFKEAKVLP